MKKIYALLLILITFKTYSQNSSRMQNFPINVIQNQGSQRLIFYVTGDGGWNNFSQNLCKELAKNGNTVISLDAKKYFWEEKTPEKFASDVAEILEYYSSELNNTKISIIGFSFGADVATFLPSRLNKILSSKLKSNVFIAPATSTGMVVKLSDMLGFGNKEGKYKVLPEINKITSNVLCIFPKEDKNVLYAQLIEDKSLKKILIPGSHKFDNDITLLLQTILKNL